MQAVQAEDLYAEEYPAAQSVQLEELAAEYFPAGQLVHETAFRPE
jgi:hypothetical protein